MRTTLTIDDDVLQKARSVAREEKRSVGEVISLLAREGLKRVGRPPQAEDAEEQLRAEAMRHVGSIRGGDPDRASQARERIRQRLSEDRDR